MKMLKSSLNFKFDNNYANYTHALFNFLFVLCSKTKQSWFNISVQLITGPNPVDLKYIKEIVNTLPNQHIISFSYFQKCPKLLLCKF